MDRDYYEDIEEVLAELNSSLNGITDELAEEIRKYYGFNLYNREKRLFPYLSVFMLIFLSVFFPSKEEALLLRMLFMGTAMFLEELNRIQGYTIFIPDAAAVLRNGKIRWIASYYLVPGDVIELEPGMKVPADCRIIKCRDLRMDESVLTGKTNVKKQKETIPESEEPLPIDEQTNMVFLGSTVLSGSGRAVVCQTGIYTTLGFLRFMEEEKKTGRPETGHNKIIKKKVKKRTQNF